MKVNAISMTARSLLGAMALLLTCGLATACSVMPFQGSSGPSSSAEPAEDEAFVAAESDETPAGFEREGEGAPGNTRDNPGGERIGSAGGVGADSVRETAAGANVEKDDKNSRAAFDAERTRDIEYRWLKDRAVMARQDGRLEDAEEYLMRALDLYPNNPDDEVKGMLDEVRTLLSKEEKVAPRWDEIPDAAQEEFELEASRAYEAAKNAEADGDWEEAIRQWEKLRRIVKFAPYGGELKEQYDDAARAGLHRARVERQKARKQLEEEALENERRMAELASEAEEDARREEIVELWRQAIHNLELHRYETAGEIVDRILFLDPKFRKAEELKRDIADNRIQQLNRTTFEARVRGMYMALRQLREAMVPEIDLVIYPTGLLAERIRARKHKDLQAIRTDPRIQATENILASKIIPLNYEDETLDNVIADIRRKANVNILIEKEVRDSKGEETVTISLDNIPVGSALNIILGDLELSTSYKSGVLFVVEPEDGSVDPASVVTRVHDVRDLMFNIVDFVGPLIRLQSEDSDGGGPSFDYGDDTEKTLDQDRIEELVGEAVGLNYGGFDADGAALQFFGGQLIATHIPAVQAELRDFLNELRQIAGLMVHMEVRFISVEDDYLSDFGIDFRGNGGSAAAVPNQASTNLEDVTTLAEDFAGGQFDNGAGGIAPANPSSGIFFNTQDPTNPPVNFNQDIRGRFEHIYDNALGNVLSGTGGFAMQFAYFNNLTQINAIITAVQQRKKARVLTAPRLSAFNTQRANVTIVNQIPYIRDFDISSSTSATIANPVVDTILDGVVLDVKPTVSNDRRFITVEVQPTIADLVLPIPTFTTTLGPTSAVTIQIPEIHVQTVQTTVRVPDGGAVVIGGLKSVRDVWRESGIPILSDIPLFGILFRRQGRDKEQFNLVIVLHARVIDLNDEEYHRPGWTD